MRKSESYVCGIFVLVYVCVCVYRICPNACVCAYVHVLVR